MEDICPYCNEAFEHNPAWVCEGECKTLYCIHCDGEIFVYKGELLNEHDPECYDSDEEFCSCTQGFTSTDEFYSCTEGFTSTDEFITAEDRN